jgi:competence protein ComEC
MEATGKRDPLARVPRLFVLLGALVVGIALAPVLPLPPALLWGAAFAALVSAFLLAPRAPAGVALLLFAFPVALHGAATARQAAVPVPNDVSLWAGRPSLWVGGVVASDVDTRRGAYGPVWTATVAVQEVNDYERVWPAGGRLRVTAHDSHSPAPGDTIWVHGRVERPPGQTNPGGFDYHAYLARRGVHATLAAKRDGDVRAAPETNTASPLTRLAALLRTAVPRATAAHLPPEDAALLDGLLLSLRGDLPADLTDAFARTGTVHVLSVSGLHLAALAAVLSWLFGRLTLPRRRANIASVLLLWVFASAAGGGPAVTRSALMATVLLLAPLLRRTADPLHSWAFAAFVILAADPLALYDVGFQLSFATVGVLLLYLPPLERWLLPWEPEMPWATRTARWVLLGVLVSVVAEVGSGALAVYHFNLLSLVAPAANLVIAPLTEVLLLSGLGAVALDRLPLPPWVTLPLWMALHGGLWLLRELALRFAAFPFAAVSVMSPPVVVIVAYYAALVGAAPFVRRRLLKKQFASRPAESPSYEPALGPS